MTTEYNTRAIKVIGKPDLHSISPYSVDEFHLYNPMGCYIDKSDPSKQLLYVNDGGNNRVMVYDWSAYLASFPNDTNLQVPGGTYIVQGFNPLPADCVRIGTHTGATPTTKGPGDPSQGGLVVFLAGYPDPPINPSGLGPPESNTLYHELLHAHQIWTVQQTGNLGGFNSWKDTDHARSFEQATLVGWNALGPPSNAVLPLAHPTHPLSIDTKSDFGTSVTIIPGPPPKLIDTSKNWVPNEFVGMFCHSGVANNTFKIVSNNSNTLTGESFWPFGAPASGLPYEITWGHFTWLEHYAGAISGYYSNRELFRTHTGAYANLPVGGGVYYPQPYPGVYEWCQQNLPPFGPVSVPYYGVQAPC